MDLTRLPATDPIDVYRYRDGLYAVDLLTAAVCEFDLFTRLAAAPMTKAEICRAFGFAERPVDVMLTLFTADGFLSRGAGVFQPTPVAREHLVSTSPFFLGPYYASLKERPVVRDFVKILRTGRPANWGSYQHQKEWSEAMLTDEFATTFTAAMDCRGAYLGAALARTIAVGPRRSLLDIAGGSGIYACSLCAHFPGLQATVLEKAPVDAICAQAIADRGFGDRIRVIAGDMLAEPLPRGHDLHLYSNVLHDWDVPIVQELLGRSFEALPSGGRLLIHDAFLNREKSGPLHVAEYSVMLMHATQGRCYGVGEMEDWLRATGFTDCLELPGGAARGGILARKP